MNAMTCLETLSREGAGNDPSGRRQSARPTSERSSRATTNAHSHHNGKKMSGGLAGTNDTNRSFSGMRTRLVEAGQLRRKLDSIGRRWRSIGIRRPVS